MEYTYKNSFKEKPVTVVLRPFSIHLQAADGETKIPYVNVTAVHLVKRRGLCKAVVEIEDRQPLVITNRFYLAPGEFENRGAAYSTFIRVLHYHLKDKSDAMFSSGINYVSLAIRFLIVCFSAALIAFIAEYAGLAVVNSFVLALMIALATLVGIFFYQRRKISKQYNPADIPLHFLP